MSDTCIVCLGDLGESASDLLVAPRPELGVDGAASDALGTAHRTSVDEEDASQIAQLLPCGHVLHNNCLKPWVERANSCPICRRNFNMVELTARLGGPVISSYAVQERIQVAEVDPSMLADYVDDDTTDFLPCSICGDADNEEVLLLCDGCDIASHTYCLSLDVLPTGPWYCDQCEIQRALGSPSRSALRTARSQDRRSRRTRAQQRRLRNASHTNSLHWARVWQSVWDRLNFDLDFPFDDERAAERLLERRRREAAQQLEFRAWQRRFDLAERLGSNNNRFQETATFLDIEAPRPSRPRVPREPSPEPESLEEMRAWNAFERAREIENNPSAARKRKEPTLSPSPEPKEPQRKLKRPRTRRTEDLAAQAIQNGESSRTLSAQTSSRLHNIDSSGEPSFLQSLLREVEEASNCNSSHVKSYGTSAATSTTPTDHASPGPSSPSLSPASSSHSSPRLVSATPPPYLRNRPVSPVQLLPSPELSSSPVFSPDLSPAGSPVETCSGAGLPHLNGSRSRSRLPRNFSRPNTSTSRSSDTSPSREGLSLTLKLEVQKLVGAALKPHYRSNAVSRDEYTDINRTISRRLYERLDAAAPLNAQIRADLGKRACDEVQKAVVALATHKEKQDTQEQHGDDDAAALL